MPNKDLRTALKVAISANLGISHANDLTNSSYVKNFISLRSISRFMK
ncbi:MAG: hypothetical protein QXZ23_02170 [Saccharolobus sp.]